MTLARDGTAAYTVNEIGVSPQPATGTVPSSMVSQFFDDLDAVAPINQPPSKVSGGGAGAGSTIISYSGETVSVYNSSDARQQALHDDFYAIAKTLGIPIPPSTAS